MRMSIRAAALVAASVAVGLDVGAAQTAPAERWDPTLVRGRTRLIDFTVDEGTIEAVDLSPDGAWVVFDLMGHVYRVPAAGGTAECLTQASGAALNYHPRYSPDGRSIAFVSDRGGQDNLWAMDADGGHPRPVFLDFGSRIRQPAWLPDGSGIVAVRVFPSVLNWELHRTTVARFPLRGGRPHELLFSDQAQYYWPAPSRDGRFLYFYRSSLLRDLDGVTQGQRLGRLDLVTGRAADLTPSTPPAPYRADPLVEFGPEISPDGRTLAFGRRIAGGSIEIRGRRYGVRTALWLRDLGTGAERVLMDPIEPDATQGNAVRHMKAIPGYRWAADGRSIVIPEGGQIRRVWVDSGRIETIRFSARIRREISETARTAFRVGEDSLRSRFLRWPATSPDGRRVVVEAVGRLWLAEGAGGRARPLTDPALGFAATPAWSPDGRWIAYATWDDRTGGRLWKLPAGGGAPVALAAEPGQYLHPTWTADGRSVIVVRGGFGGSRTDHTWWDLVRIPAEGGPAVRVGEVPEAVRPSLLGGGIVVPVREPSGDLGAPARRGEYPENRGRLTSIRATGRPRSLGVVPGEAAAVSPDGRWVAFVNRLDLYLAPMSLVGAARTPLRSSAGIRRLTRRGGLYPRWNGSDVLEYQSGDRHYRYHVAAGRLDSAQIEVVVPRSIVGGTVALMGARILTMASRRVIERGTVVVRGGRIACVGECPTDGADRVVDLAGRTLMPGLVDVHAHHLRGSPLIGRRHQESARYLAYGVTTVIDPAPLSDPGFPTAELIEAGEIVGPRTFGSGDILEGSGAISDIGSYRDAVDQVARLASWGAIEIKSYHQPNRIARQMLARAGREAGLTVTGEGEDLFRNLAFIIDGLPGWEHNLPYPRLYRDAVTFFGRAGVHYSATLNVSSPQLRGQEYHLARSGVWEDPKEQRFTPIRELAQSRYWVLRPESEYAFPSLANGLADIIRAGGRGAVGGHGEWHGLDTHWDLWSGAMALEPMEALEVATWQGASYFGLDRDVGTVEVGKVADLVVLDGDPLADIRNSRRLHLVMKAGRLYDAATLDEVWPQARPYR